MSAQNSEDFTPYRPTTPQVPTGVYASPTLGKLFEALAKAQGEFDVAIFDAENPHFRNRFATLKAVDAATKKQLVKHGLAVTQLPYTGGDGAPHMLTVLGHTSGEFIGGDLRLILQKQDMQGLGSAVTYGKRYAKSAILGVVSDEDDDGNAASDASKNHNTAPPIDEGIFEEEDTRAVNDPNDPGTFVFNLPKFKGKRLKDIPRKDLVSYLNYMNSPKAGPLSNDGKKLLEAASRFLGDRTEI